MKTKDSEAIYVAWQDPASRRWAPVGLLTRSPEGDYAFVYTRGAKDSEGFELFHAMGDLNSKYISSELFPFFANRTLPRSRPERAEYMAWLGLTSECADLMTELSRASGLRATDSFELFPCPVRTKSNNYRVYFWARGLSHMDPGSQDRARTLSVGERLFLTADLQNEQDPHALLIRTDDPVSLVGYAPRYYAEELSQLLVGNAPDDVRLTVERVNRAAPMQHRVLLKLEAPWPENFIPCSSPSFETLGPLGRD